MVMSTSSSGSSMGEGTGESLGVDVVAGVVSVESSEKCVATAASRGFSQSGLA